MKYFSIDELTRSTVAQMKGIKNIPSKKDIDALNDLVDNVLDPLREAWGAPITVSSGFRSENLNMMVGGAYNSEHKYGRAADITAGSPELNQKLFNLAISLNLPFRQLIDEKNFKWIHISYNTLDIKRQILHIK